MTTTSRRGRRILPAVLATALAAGALGALGAGDALAGNGHGNGHGPGGKHRSVIFVNGDGMSAAHREALRLFQEGFDGQTVMGSLPVAGLQQTDPRDPKEAVTDSAAAATAWATGQKTYNGSISYSTNGKELPALGEQAKQSGKSTGLVTTAQVTDASPAAFFAQVPDRGAQDEIARQYVEESKPDLILGGGEDWWLPAGTPGAYPDKPAEDPTEASKGTKGNLIEKAQANGYTYVSTAAGLRSAPEDKPLLGLFANEEVFQQRAEGKGDVYSPVVPLADITKVAIDRLSSDKDGFFLFVEEEAVDEFSHQNNATRMLQAMQQLDAAVAVAKAYVDQHPDTLLIVTGDHDCGGLTVENVDATDESGAGGTLPADQAGDVSGTKISGEDGQVQLNDVSSGTTGSPFPIKGSQRTFVLDWTTTGHTGVPTVVTAEGSGADELTGYYPNTHLYDVMHDLLVG